MVDDGVTGFIAPPDVAEFTGKLNRLASDPALRADMGAAGRKKALTFSWDAVLDDLITNYREAMAAFYTNGRAGDGPQEDKLAEAA